MIAPIFPVMAGIDPTAGSVVAFIGLLGAGIAGVYSKFQDANVKAEAARLSGVVANCEARCQRLEEWIRAGQVKLEVAEGEIQKWKTRCEALGWKDSAADPRSSSPTKNGPT